MNSLVMAVVICTPSSGPPVRMVCVVPRYICTHTRAGIPLCAALAAEMNIALVSYMSLAPQLDVSRTTYRTTSRVGLGSSDQGTTCVPLQRADAPGEGWGIRGRGLTPSVTAVHSNFGMGS